MKTGKAKESGEVDLVLADVDIVVPLGVGGGIGDADGVGVGHAFLVQILVKLGQIVKLRKVLLGSLEGGIGALLELVGQSDLLQLE